MLEKLPQRWRGPTAYFIALTLIVATTFIFDSEIAGSIMALALLSYAIGRADSQLGMWPWRKVLIILFGCVAASVILGWIYDSAIATYTIMPIALGICFGRWDGVRLSKAGKTW